MEIKMQQQLACNTQTHNCSCNSIKIRHKATLILMHVRSQNNQAGQPHASQTAMSRATPRRQILLVFVTALA